MHGFYHSWSIYGRYCFYPNPESGPEHAGHLVRILCVGLPSFLMNLPATYLKKNPNYQGPRLLDYCLKGELRRHLLLFPTLEWAWKDHSMSSEPILLRTCRTQMFERGALNRALTLPHYSRGPKLLKSSGIINLGALCV